MAPPSLHPLAVKPHRFGFGDAWVALVIAPLGAFLPSNGGW